jgi:3-hydroxyisobutyrate dehydrogenase
LVSRAQFVITMLPTAEIILTVVEPLLEEWPEEAIWLQMSSVGAVEADRLVQVAADHRVTVFDAPFSGSAQPAEGQADDPGLGTRSARARVEPVLAALG